MPFGGLSMYGSGLQLQPATPGVADQGNFHVSGTGIADVLLTSRGSTAEINKNVIMGIGATGTNISKNAYQCVVLGTTAGGSSCQLGNLFDNTIGGAVIVGAQASAQRNYCIAIGQNTNSTSTAFGDAREGNNTVIGKDATAITLNRAAVDGSVAIGYGSHADGDDWAVAVGSRCAAQAPRSIAIGNASAALARTRAIMIDTDGAAATTAGQIQIGNINHTGPVTIGPYSLTTGLQSAAVAVNDANYVFAAGVYRAQWSAITAARTTTLPLANSVPIGTRVSITDTSGSCSAVNTITAGPSGADTINGALSPVLNAAYASREFESNGVSKWIVVR